MRIPLACRRALLVPVVLLLVGWLFVALAPPAAAHASLVEMSPSADVTVDQAPTEVRLTFNEGVTVSSDSIRVFDPSARELGSLEVEGTGVEVVANLPTLESTGSYTVAWKVVSPDGHPIRGAYLFHLGEPTLSEPVEAGLPTTSTTADAFRAIGAVIALAGLVVCVGAGLLGARRSDAPRWWAMRWVPVAAGTTLLLGGSIVSVGSSLSESLEVVLDTSSGRMAVVAVVLAVAGLITSVTSVTSVPPRVDLVLAVLTATAIALQGHAVSLPPVALSAVLTVVHVLAAVAWAAGLFWLERRSRTVGEDELRADVLRFSPRGMAMVVLLAVTGVVLVVDRVPLGELLSTNYGRLGVLKVVLLGVAVLAAVRNKVMVDRDDDAADADDATGSTSASRGGAATLTRAAVSRSLRSGIRLEMVVLALALVAGAVLAQVPPPDGSGAADGGLYIERRPFGDGQLEITVDPGTRGVNEIHVVALGNDGRLMAEAAELVLGLELPEEDVGPIEPDMQAITAGHSMTYARVPLEGEWTFTVTSRVDEFTELTAEFQVPIGG